MHRREMSKESHVCDPAAESALGLPANQTRSGLSALSFCTLLNAMTTLNVDSCPVYTTHSVHVCVHHLFRCLT